MVLRVDLPQVFFSDETRVIVPVDHLELDLGIDAKSE
jgi:hypothetical protein